MKELFESPRSWREQTMLYTSIPAERIECNIKGLKAEYADGRISRNDYWAKMEVMNTIWNQRCRLSSTRFPHRGGYQVVYDEVDADMGTAKDPTRYDGSFNIPTLFRWMEKDTSDIFNVGIVWRYARLDIFWQNGALGSKNLAARVVEINETSARNLFTWCVLNLEQQGKSFFSQMRDPEGFDFDGKAKFYYKKVEGDSVTYLANYDRMWNRFHPGVVNTDPFPRFYVYSSPQMSTVAVEGKIKMVKDRTYRLGLTLLQELLNQSFLELPQKYLPALFTAIAVRIVAAKPKEVKDLEAKTKAAQEAKDELAREFYAHFYPEPDYAIPDTFELGDWGNNIDTSVRPENCTLNPEQFKELYAKLNKARRKYYACKKASDRANAVHEAFVERFPVGLHRQFMRRLNVTAEERSALCLNGSAKVGSLMVYRSVPEIRQLMTVAPVLARQMMSTDFLVACIKKVHKEEVVNKDSVLPVGVQGLDEPVFAFIKELCRKPLPVLINEVKTITWGYKDPWADLNGKSEVAPATKSQTELAKKIGPFFGWFLSYRDFERLCELIQLRNISVELVRRIERSHAELLRALVMDDADETMAYLLEKFLESPKASIGWGQRAFGRKRVKKDWWHVMLRGVYDTFEIRGGVHGQHHWYGEGAANNPITRLGFVRIMEQSELWHRDEAQRRIERAKANKQIPQGPYKNLFSEPYQDKKYVLEHMEYLHQLEEAALHFKNCMGGYGSHCAQGMSYVYVVRDRKTNIGMAAVEIQKSNLDKKAPYRMTQCEAPNHSYPEPRVRKFAQQAVDFLNENYTEDKEEKSAPEPALPEWVVNRRQQREVELLGPAPQEEEDDPYAGDPFAW